MFENGKRPHITVVGDLILDRYLIGDATKLNPEQPGVVIRVDKEDDRLGGAAAVAMIAAGFGARVTLAGVVGRDEPGRRLQRMIVDHGIERHLWIEDRPTTWKQRIVARGQLRPDRCDRKVMTSICDHAARFLSTVRLSDMLLISDYGKGVCTTALLQKLGGRTRAAGVATLVDPARARPWSDYGSVTLIKANQVEASAVTGSHRFHPLALVKRLSEEHRCHVVVTLGRHGTIASESSGSTWYFPTEKVERRDVCGAGDTVIALLGVAVAGHTPVRNACKIATRAAICQVMTLGVQEIEGWMQRNGCQRGSES